MIRYEIGKGKTCIAYGRLKTGELVITIHRLLNTKEIGEKGIDESELLDGVCLVVHNAKGLAVLEKVIKITKAILEDETS